MSSTSPQHFPVLGPGGYPTSMQMPLPDLYTNVAPEMYPSAPPVVSSLSLMTGCHLTSHEDTFYEQGSIFVCATVGLFVSVHLLLLPSVHLLVCLSVIYFKHQTLMHISKRQKVKFASYMKIDTCVHIAAKKLCYYTYPAFSQVMAEKLGAARVQFKFFSCTEC